MCFGQIGFLSKKHYNPESGLNIGVYHHPVLVLSEPKADGEPGEYTNFAVISSNQGRPFRNEVSKARLAKYFPIHPATPCLGSKQIQLKLSNGQELGKISWAKMADIYSIETEKLRPWNLNTGPRCVLDEFSTLVVKHHLDGLTTESTRPSQEPEVLQNFKLHYDENFPKLQSRRQSSSSACQPLGYSNIFHPTHQPNTVMPLAHLGGDSIK